jgi:putative nucleotidyltransferase with HDIG domain
MGSKKLQDSRLMMLYKSETLERCNRMVRFVAIFVMIGNPTFLILDYFMSSRNILDFILARSFMSFGMLAVYIIARSNYGLKYAMWLGVAACFVCSIDITVLIHMTGGSSSPYYAGLLIILFALCIWVPLEFRLGLICAVAVYLIYAVPFLIFRNINDIPVFINNNYFMLVIFFLSVSSLKFYNDIRFNEFKSRYEIQKANEDLKRITDELEETNQKLLTHDKLKTEFFTNVSHELRTPLTLILAPLNTLIHNRQDNFPDTILSTLSIMQNNGLRLLKQINNLLDFAKLEAGRMRLNFQEVDLIKFCEDIVATVQHMAASRGLKLYFQYQMEDGIRVMIDTEQFEKVVINLLHNAIKFTGSGGRITLCIDDHDEDVELVVEDTGEGIPADMLETIFDRFAQVDGSSTRTREGTGLGLSLAREIVELHGGTIRATSTQGQGSRFIVQILKGDLHINENIRERRKAEQPVQYKKRASDNEGLKVSDVVSNYRDLQLIDLEQRFDLETHDHRSGIHDYTILVIDDNPDILKLMHFLLTDEFDLLLCSSGRKGMALLRENMPDLVICDVMMPEMDGYSFCREVKADPSFKHIPIMLVTARAGSEMLVAGIDSGANDYLAKPFDVDELKARVRSLLRTRTIEEALALANHNLKIRTDDLMDRQRTLLLAMVKSLVSTIEAKDNYTKDHSLRVSRYSMAIARKMGFADHELKDLELAALLHDVGKIAVPEEILRNTKKLTDDEFDQIKNHPLNGALILKPITEFNTVASIIIAHHEHYNGKGYPYALFKDDIPLGARVMAIADAYDAMTSERPYRTALSHNYTLKEIVRCSGSQFDPGIVDVFLGIHDAFSDIRNNGSRTPVTENN